MILRTLAIHLKMKGKFTLLCFGNSGKRGILVASANLGLTPDSENSPAACLAELYKPKP